MRYHKTYVCRKWSMLEWYWQGKTKVLGEKSVPVPLCPPQISRTHLGSNPGLLAERETNRLKPWPRPFHDQTECTSHSVRPSQRTVCASIITTDRWMLCTKQQLFVERITRSKYRHSPGEMQNFVLYPTVHTVGYHWASRVTRYYVVPCR
jgi:hypothetical protein